MSQSETIGAIAAALAKAQAEIQTVARDRAVEVKIREEKGGGGYSSKYATLSHLYDACRGVLASNGIAVLQPVEHHEKLGACVRTMLVHESGEWIDGHFPIKTSRDGAQGFGGGISFARRWGLAGMVMLVSADDVDEARGYKDERRAPTRAPRASAPPPDVAAAIAAINGATTAQVPEVARLYRAAFDGSPDKPKVERAIADWFVAAYERADANRLREIHSVFGETKVQAALAPMVREAGQAAAARLRGGP